MLTRSGCQLHNIPSACCKVLTAVSLHYFQGVRRGYYEIPKRNLSIFQVRPQIAYLPHRFHTMVGIPAALAFQNLNPPNRSLPKTAKMKMSKNKEYIIVYYRFFCLHRFTGLVPQKTWGFLR